MFHLAYALNFALNFATNWGTEREEEVEAPVEAATEAGPLGIKLGNNIGQGSYGAVSKCYISNKELAIKKLAMDQNAAELQPWCLTLRHENVIGIHGILMDETSSWIIMDLHEGDLFGFINENKRCVEGNFL